MLKYQAYVDRYVEDLTGKTVVITGANSGIGFAASRYLAYKGARIVMACRNMSKATKARDKLREDVPDAQVDILQYDQASIFMIEQFADELQKKYKHIDAFVLNAGVYHPKKGLKTKDGLPLTIGTNFVGVYYLIRLLEHYFLSCPGLRLVIVGSILHVAGKWRKSKDMKFLNEDWRSTVKQYCVSKRMLMALEEELVDEYRDQIIVTCMHPGVAATGIITEQNSAYPKLIANLGNRFLRTFANSPDKSSLGIVLLVGKKDIKDGDYLVPRGLGHLTGMPTKKHMPNFRRSSAHIMKNAEKTIENIKEREREEEK